MTHTHTHTHTHGRPPVDEGSARFCELYLYNTQHAQGTTIHVLGETRNRNPSKRAAADPRLKTARLPRSAYIILPTSKLIACWAQLSDVDF